MKKNKWLKILLFIVAVLIVALIMTGVVFKIYTSHYYVSDQAEIAAIENSVSGRVKTFSNDNGTLFMPADQEPKAVIAFYPGGKVEYTAYSGIMYELAAEGYIGVLLKMHDNLAFLSIDAIDKAIGGRQDDQDLASDLDWYLAGHSLGGVAASVYLKDDLEKNGDDSRYKGIILCASYTTEDFSDKDIRLLSIYGENDRILTLGKYEESKAKWPEDSTEVVIKGGIHSYFGSYGIQRGDGEPEITDVDQIMYAAKEIDEWISKK